MLTKFALAQDYLARFIYSCECPILWDTAVLIKTGVVLKGTFCWYSNGLVRRIGGGNHSFVEFVFIVSCIRYGIDTITE